MIIPIAAWPFSTTDLLAGLMGGVTRRRANQVLRSLRARALVQREPQGYVLTHEGLTCLSRRDRAAVGTTLDRWTPQQSDDGVYFGIALRAIASQSEHQRGITEFAARLRADAACSPDYELLDLLPTHRSQITYWHSGNRYVLHPDASFQFGHRGDWCLLEYKRRAVTRSGYLRGCAATDATSRVTTPAETTAEQSPWCCSCSRATKRKPRSSTPPPDSDMPPSSLAAYRP